MNTDSSNERSLENKELAAGADLWVIPALAESSWAPQIEWLCNMQLSKNSLHNTQEVPESIKLILKECDLPEYNFTQHFSSDSLQKVLIPSEKWLPNRWILCLPFSENGKWAKTIELTWVQLKKPTIRIFLPNQIDKSTAKKLFGFLPNVDNVETDTLIFSAD